MTRRHEIARYPVTAESPGRERPDWEWWRLEYSPQNPEKLKIRNDRAGGFALRDIDDWAAAMACLLKAASIYIHRGELGAISIDRFLELVETDPGAAAALRVLSIRDSLRRRAS
ncbi:MAG: hypothetical protein E6Q97_08120 [Desulfurellales bacterium]|nr:MAG: hypothetical protein E6Q97_08120 [Desulfurellales bacterium]